MTQAISYDKIGKNLRKIRKDQKLSVIGLMNKVKAQGGTVSRQHIYAVEKGQYKLSLDMLAALCRALGVLPCEILNNNKRKCA